MNAFIEDDKKIQRDGIHKKYFDHFGEDPQVIGIFWDEPETLKDNLEKAIRENKPYNEIDLLSPEEKKLFNEGKLLF